MSMTRKGFTWRVINWRNIEALLLEYYDVWKSKEGADVYPIEFGEYSIGAYPPLMLLKCMLLQKWFRVQSDPELETQINDRTSFKTFLSLSLDESTTRSFGGEPSPDHSTFRISRPLAFSRFRSRLLRGASNSLRRFNKSILFFSRTCREENRVEKWQDL